MDTSKSNNDAILDYIETGEIKGLPADLMTLDESSVMNYLDRNKNAWQRMFRGQTLPSIDSSSGFIFTQDQTVARMRAIHIYDFTTSVWVNQRDVFVTYYFNRDGDWVRLTRRFETGRWVVDNSKVIDTSDFVHDLVLAGNSPTKVLEIVHRSLEQYAESYVRIVQERLTDAQAYTELFTLLKERTQNLLP